MRKVKILLFLLTFLLLLTACANNEPVADYHRVEIDMTYKEVIGFLGEPDALPVTLFGEPYKEICEWRFDDGTILTVNFGPPGDYRQKLEDYIVSAYEIILGPIISAK